MRFPIWAGIGAVAFTLACGEESGSSLGTGTTEGTGASGGTTTTAMTGGGGTTTTSSTTTDGGMGGMPPAEYPMGPYGNQEGEIFPYLTWEGYLKTDPATLATTETWTPTYSSLDLFQSGSPYALIHTTLSG